MMNTWQAMLAGAGMFFAGQIALGFIAVALCRGGSDPEFEPERNPNPDDDFDFGFSPYFDYHTEPDFDYDFEQAVEGMVQRNE